MYRVVINWKKNDCNYWKPRVNAAETVKTTRPNRTSSEHRAGLYFNYFKNQLKRQMLRETLIFYTFMSVDLDLVLVTHQYE